MVALTPAPFYNYLSPDWIDFRVLTGPNSYPFSPQGLGTANVMYGMYVGQAIVLPPIFAFCCYLIYLKVIKAGVAPWSIVNGAIVPRGPEVWCLSTAPYLLIAWIYSILMLTETMKSYALKEFLFDVKWPLVYIGTTSYAWALIHATPKTGLNGKETFLPSTAVLNFGYIFITGLAVFPLSFAITSGIYADRGEDAKADFYVRAHYLSWSIACIFDISVLVLFAVNLIGILKENTKNMQANKSK
ncbi:hypothetical protein HDV05_006130, partial [Chytridiales sp. JEL 0842]